MLVRFAHVADFFDRLDISETKAVLAGGYGLTADEAAEVAMGYNPTMDFYTGTTTPYIDARDVIYCTPSATGIR